MLDDLKKIGLIVFILYSCLSFAEEGLSLQQALREGVDQNPSLKISKAALDESIAKKRESFGSYLPRVDIVANHVFDLKYQVIQLSPTTIFESTYPKTSYGALATLNLFDGLKTTFNYKGAASNAEAADYEFQQTQLISENVIQLKYYQALAAQVLAEVAQTNVLTLTEHLKRAQDLLKQGEFTKVDVLKIQVQLEQAVPEKLAALDNVYLTRKNLAEVMGVEFDNRPLVEILPIPNADKIKALESLDITSTTKNRLDLLALQKRAEASESFYKANHSIWLPKINLTADYQNYNNRNYSLSESDKFKNSYAVGINLTWNLFDGGASYSKLAGSYYQKIQLEQKVRKLMLASSNELDFWKRRYLNSAILYSAKMRSVDASAESVRIYKNGLKAGTRTNSDLLDAELELDRSKAGVVKAQVDAVEALLNLELALGRRL